MGGAAPGGGLSTGFYEFGHADNAVLEKTGSRARWWGILSLVGGVFGLLLALLFVFGILLTGATSKLGAGAGIISAAILGFVGPISLVYLVVGRLYMGAGSALVAVVETQGNDVEHLMQALDKMARAFRLEVIMTIGAFVLGTGVVVAAYLGLLVVSV
jgi:hypothetical protein